MAHKSTFYLRFILLLLPFFIITSCREAPHPPPLIAVSKASPNYLNWLRQGDSTIRYVNLYPLGLDSALLMLEHCDGLLITGGEDVYPGHYGQESDTNRCGTISHFRDTLEIKSIQYALEEGMPILGVCRGEQLMNVVFGGTLYIDLPTDLDTLIQHRCGDPWDCNHWVTLDTASLLYDLSGCDSALVNTNHHQGVRILASNLHAGAFAADGLTEAIELKDSQSGSFLLGVQWHPERMEFDHPLSGPLLVHFLHECREYQRHQH